MNIPQPVINMIKNKMTNGMTPKSRSNANNSETC